ncbi:polysaccharide deacetylase family protein [Natrarchaeobaculum sulfurireducens]|uniref:Peptidoglycan/xylan/chitin deacetylase n=1 Tax=Natrarchaeobaculum sulfurireducens TaxID=2044521 RepID=A0A346PGT0_9EURY|nr:polysaccharide deacetylase family protein [Natrarchaeobaculum sulfurireducens]AXR78725.1 Peptidoglycan/xylan/chitin deacetylase [Natrarchaeobaculum sulfurireducens]
MGSVVLSVDAELAWGFHDLPEPPRQRIRNARWGWQRLLELLEDYDVPATWGVVGHLLLESCDGRHADHPAAADGWFEREPGGSFEDDDRWYGLDLVAAVRNGRPSHEIGCHTFSHVVFDQSTDRAVVDAELERCVSVADRHGLSLESFVFPRNVVGHRDALAEYDFDCYRGIGPPRWYDHSRFYRPGKLASFVAGRTPPPLVVPEIDEHGLVNVPASLCLFSFEGTARSVVEPFVGDPVLRKAKLGIDAAASSDGICHFWLHPNDITSTRDVRRLRRIFTYLEAKRDETPLQVETMAGVARRVSPDEATRPAETVADESVPVPRPSSHSASGR